MYLSILSPDFKTVVKNLIPARYPSDFSTSLSISNPINNTILFTYGLGDTIYQFGNNSFQPILAVNLRNTSISDEMKNQDYTEIFRKLIDREGEVAAYGSGLYWDQKHVFFDILYQKKDFLCCYNMQTKKTTICSKIIGGEKEIYLDSPHLVYNENLMFSLEAVNVSSEIKSDDSKQTKKYGVFSSFEEVQKNTYADDNPILVLMKPKSDL